MRAGLKHYRVDCGGARIQNGVTATDGEDCGNPHGQVCNASQKGQSFGTVACKIIALEYGNPAQDHGQTTIENCSCIDCDTQGGIGNMGGEYTKYACER